MIAANRNPGPNEPISMQQAPLIDSVERLIFDLRVSVTERCDFRRVNCMSENMSFLP
jgi:hypothetical protein